MAKFRDSQTAKNLLVSFALECQAQNRYRFFSTRAAEEGFYQIEGLFFETAEEEYEHSLRFFKFFNEGELEITHPFLTGAIKRTVDNLTQSAALEHNVYTSVYPGFADIAEAEGFKRAADTWNAISVAEAQHERMFLALADNIKTGKIFDRPNPVKWKCRNCGYIHEGEKAPLKCPACVRPTGHFELLAMNW